ncbi:hypothetical protein AAULR_25221, partial [Lacticaseibacillus rhamnosus MTCC 5462]
MRQGASEMQLQVPFTILFTAFECGQPDLTPPNVIRAGTRLGLV